MAATQLNSSLLCIKYLLCAINALFMLTSVMIISIGTRIYNVYQNFRHFLDPTYVLPATILIIVGGLIFVVVFFGCYGAIKESTCMVSIFTASLSIVLILEIAAAITAYALQDSVKSSNANKINATIQEYDTSLEFSNAIDRMQSQLQCCGCYGASDWKKIDGKQRFENPASCCEERYRSESGQINCIRYEEGCFSVMSRIVEHSAIRIGNVVIAVALIQFSGIMFAWILGRAIRRQKTERERRRWELRESLIKDYQPIGKSDLLATFSSVYMQSNVPKSVKADGAS